MKKTYLSIVALSLGAALFAAGPVCAVDLAITAEPYFTSGLFTNPLIPTEKDTVRITVRATVEGEIMYPRPKTYRAIMLRC